MVPALLKFTASVGKAISTPIPLTTLIIPLTLLVITATELTEPTPIASSELFIFIVPLLVKTASVAWR